MDVKNAFFNKFREEEAAAQRELKVEKPKAPEIVVVTYEILDFIRMKGADEGISVNPDFVTALGNLDAYHALCKELYRGYAINETSNEWKRKIKGVINGIVAMEHECPFPEVALYSPLMFIEERGINDYEPEEKHEHTLVQDCLDYLRGKIAEDIEEGIIVPDALKQMVFFSGLHGQGGPGRIAKKIAQQFGIADKMIISSTGSEDASGLVKKVYGGREHIVEIINAYMKLPYVECRNRFEQGLRGLDEIIR